MIACTISVHAVCQKLECERNAGTYSLAAQRPEDGLSGRRSAVAQPPRHIVHLCLNFLQHTSASHLL